MVMKQLMGDQHNENLKEMCWWGWAVNWDYRNLSAWPVLKFCSCKWTHRYRRTPTLYTTSEWNL